MSDEPDRDDEGVPDAIADDGPEGAEDFERPVDKFKQSTAGSILAAGMMGLADALDWRPKKEETAIVQEASEPVRDLDIVIDLEHPERTIAILRPEPPAEN